MKNANVKANPFFEVDRIPVFADWNGEKLDTGKTAIINKENGNIYGLVSPKYKVVTNEEIANIFDVAFKDYPVDNIVDHVNNDGAKWYREIIFGGEYQKEVKVGDAIKTKIRIHNAYDGLQSVGYEFGSMRLICTNGMTSFRKEGKVTFRHFMNDIVDQIKQSFDFGVNKFMEELEFYKQLTNIPYTEKQFHKFIINQVKVDDEKGIISEKQANKMLELYPSIRNQYNDHEDTKWSHLNVLTAIQTHHTKAHNGSNMFSAGYRNMQSVINEFVKS